MEVILQDHIPEEVQALLLLEEAPGIEHDLGRVGPGEHRQPGDDGAGQEVRLLLLPDAIARARHGSLRARDAKRSFAAVRSQAELGNEGKPSFPWPVGCSRLGSGLYYSARRRPGITLERIPFEYRVPRMITTRV